MSDGDRWARYCYDLELRPWRARDGWRLHPPPRPSLEEMMAAQRPPTEEDRAWMRQVAIRAGLIDPDDEEVADG